MSGSNSVMGSHQDDEAPRLILSCICKIGEPLKGRVALISSVRKSSEKSSSMMQVSTSVSISSISSSLHVLTSSFFLLSGLGKPSSDLVSIAASIKSEKEIVRVFAHEPPKSPER